MFVVQFWVHLSVGDSRLIDVLECGFFFLLRAICCLPTPTRVYILTCSVPKSVGRTVDDTYPGLGWQTTRDFSRLKGLQCVRVGLHLEDKAYETIYCFT